MGLNWAEHTEEIEAPVEVCFDAIVDYESFSRWQDAVDSVEVIDRTPDGLGQDVRLFVDAKIRKIDYVLRYSYTRPTEIRWDFVEGNGMRDVDGVYTLESLGPERTRATYNLGADPELPVPGMILRRVAQAARQAQRPGPAGRGRAPLPGRRGCADLDARCPRAGCAGGRGRADRGGRRAGGRAGRAAAGPAQRRLGAEGRARVRGPRGAKAPAPLREPPDPPERLRPISRASSPSRRSRPAAPWPGALSGRGWASAEQALEVGREAADGLIRRLNDKLDDRDRRD